MDNKEYSEMETKHDHIKRADKGKVISAHLVTSEFRGDHSADVRKVIDCSENTTVKELTEILAKDDSTAYIEIRIGGSI